MCTRITFGSLSCPKFHKCLAKMYFTLPLNLNLDHGSYEVSSKQHWDNKFDYDKNLLHLTRIRTIGDALGDGVRDRLVQGTNRPTVRTPFQCAIRCVDTFDNSTFHLGQIQISQRDMPRYR